MCVPENITTGTLKSITVPMPIKSQGSRARLPAWASTPTSIADTDKLPTSQLSVSFMTEPPSSGCSEYSLRHCLDMAPGSSTPQWTLHRHHHLHHDGQQTALLIKDAMSSKNARGLLEFPSVSSVTTSLAHSSSYCS